MRVIATKIGYYGLRRRKVDDEFDIESEAAFSAKWMKKVGVSASGQASKAMLPEEVKGSTVRYKVS